MRRQPKSCTNPNCSHDGAQVICRGLCHWCYKAIKMAESRRRLREAEAASPWLAARNRKKRAEEQARYRRRKAIEELANLPIEEAVRVLKEAKAGKAGKSGKG